MGKTYSIRKVGGGRGVKQTSEKEKSVLVSFPHSATPLNSINLYFSTAATTFYFYHSFLQRS